MSKTFSVYHRATLWTRRDIPKNATEALGWPELYNLVAVVRLGLPENGLEEVALETTYLLTQHLDRPWHQNPEVETKKESRSTSVGDVIEDGETRWVVAPLGFKRLP